MNNSGFESSSEVSLLRMSACKLLIIELKTNYVIHSGDFWHSSLRFGLYNVRKGKVVPVNNIKA
jgi:hypothetical protein